MSQYYSSNNEVASASNLIKAQVDKFITGMKIIKKSNFSDHVKKSVSHLNALNGLNQPLETPSNQTSIIVFVRGMNQKLKDELGKPFKLYSDIASFKKDIHNVNLGNSDLTDTSCCEMLHFLSKCFVNNNVTEPLNDGTIRYYSVHNDGSYSRKIMDEKELFITKTDHKSEVKSSLMLLEEPEKANAEGLKLALENSILKLELNIERKNREVYLFQFYIKKSGNRKKIFFPKIE